jgi:glycosyltransferase involved in cell wall biosynthesis
MNTRDISVIIPSADRSTYLEKTLIRFDRQTMPRERFEVVVVDDGSVDATPAVVDRVRQRVSYGLRYIRQEKRGPACARNKGVREADAEYLFFTGDDIVPHEDLLRQHLEVHGRFPDAAILGFVEWSSDLDVTDFMRYIAPDGFQFRYGSIRDSADCGFRHFYTSNISLSRRWFDKGGFDEEFPYAALEDTELAYRLEKRGLKIVLNRKAIGYHDHPTTCESFCKRMKIAGLSSAIMVRKHPELKSLFLPVPLMSARIVFGGVKKMRLLRRVNRAWYWYSQIVGSYVEGYEEGLVRDRN